MSIQNRHELIELFKSNRLKIEDPDGAMKDWVDREYKWNNPFQQCSIDLRVGFIYVPGSDSYATGGAYNPKTDEHVLGTGQTAMIRTKEKITLPNDIGGICFSPSRLALKALLITNMGHVDPGYSGHLHFTAINMGKDPFTFRGDDIICSMIFLKLSGEVPPFGSEYFKEMETTKGKLSIPAVIANYFPRLARDFVDVEKRAQSVAKNEINKTKIWQIGVPLLVALFLAVNSYWQYLSNKSLEKELNQVHSKIESIEKSLNYDSRIKDLENKLSNSIKQKPSSHD